MIDRKPAKPTVSLQIRISPELSQKFKDLCEGLGVSRNAWIVLAIEEAVQHTGGSK